MVNKTWVALLTCIVGLFGALFTGLGTNTLDKVLNRDEGRQQEAPGGSTPNPAESPKSGTAPAKARLDPAGEDDASTEGASASSNPLPVVTEDAVATNLQISASDVRINLGKINNNGGRFGTVTLNLSFTNQSSGPLRFIVHNYTGKKMSLVLADGSTLQIRESNLPTCRESDLRRCAQRDADAFQNLIQGETLNYSATFNGAIPNSGSKTVHDLSPAKLYSQLQLLDSDDRPYILPVQLNEIELN